MPDRMLATADSDRPWWKRWRSIMSLILLATAAAMIVVVMLALGKSNGFGRAATWIAIGGALFELIIGVTIVRRDYWRVPAAPNLDSCLTLILLGLSAVAVVGFTSLTCIAVGAN
jgi:hypothetical protein